MSPSHLNRQYSLEVAQRKALQKERDALLAEDARRSKAYHVLLEMHARAVKTLHVTAVERDSYRTELLRLRAECVRQDASEPEETAG